MQEKLEQIESLKFQLEVRDIYRERDDWFQAYQYEVPVLFKVQPQPINSAGEAAFSPEELLPRPSPRLQCRPIGANVTEIFANQIRDNNTIYDKNSGLNPGLGVRGSHFTR